MSERTTGDTLRVAVAGVNGRLGRVAQAAIAASSRMSFAGGLARAKGDQCYVSMVDLVHVEAPDVVVDCTLYPASLAISMDAIAHGVRPVIGVSGWSNDDFVTLEAEAKAHGVGAMHVPNFALGAALMMRFAEQAAHIFSSAEIIELHHEKKLDAPSGTSKATAQRISRVTGVTPPIHSVRLRGMLAHQEVLFGGEGEVLTLRHDSLSRDSFRAGIVLAVERVMNVVGFESGLDLALKDMLA